MLKLSLEKRRTLILMSSGIIFALSGILGLLKFLQLGVAEFPYAAAIICLLIAINSAYLLSGGLLANSEAILMLILLGGYAGATANSGGFDGAPSTLAPILPMVAILCFGAETGWKFLGLVVASLCALLILDLNNVFPETQLSRQATTISHFFSALFTSVICAWIAWAFARNKEIDINHNQQQASEDHLTGLSNRRALDSALLREVGRARRDQSWLCLVLVDVDLFKRYNDANGHQAGDKCLVKVANLLTQAAQRPSDLVSRYGGEEFAVLLPNTNSEGAFYIAEGIRKAMLAAGISYEIGGTELLSLTLGVIAIEGSSIKSITELVAEADAALYRGKADGRNKVVVKSISTNKVGKMNYA